MVPASAFQVRCRPRSNRPPKAGIQGLQKLLWVSEMKTGNHLQGREADITFQNVMNRQSIEQVTGLPKRGIALITSCADRQFFCKSDNMLHFVPNPPMHSFPSLLKTNEVFSSGYL